MKQILGIFALLWLYCTQPLLAQVPQAIDARDYIGQRLGWSADKIYDVMKAEANYTFYANILQDNGKDNMLCYNGSRGETLTYFIEGEKAGQIILGIPIGSAEVQGMINLLTQQCRLIGADKASNTVCYLSPYAKILVYEGPLDEKTGRPEKICFNYRPASN